MVEFLPSINYSVVRSINSSKLPGLWNSSFQVGCGKDPEGGLSLDLEPADKEPKNQNWLF